MNYAIGYQLPDELTDIAQLAIDKKDKVKEVYFPWINTPSGRSPLGVNSGYTDYSAQSQLENDLKRLKENGIKLDLLLNSNCMGEDAVSVSLAKGIESIIYRIKEVAGGVDVVTTASLAIAYIVKQIDPQIDVRASVNMRLGSVKALEYVSHLFDSFYIQRDFNRDLERIKDIRKWCDDNGKGLCFLANSGCMSFCSGQTFHDNMVAHERQIANVQNIKGFVPQICRQHYKNVENWGTVLKSTWVRPEDIHNYEGLFDIAKLATRMHQNPALVVEAYTRGRYFGNLLDLFEPSNGDLLYPFIVDNASFPEDFFERTTACDKQCHKCGYCDKLIKELLIKAE